MGIHRAADDPLGYPRKFRLRLADTTFRYLDVVGLQLDAHTAPTKL